MTTVDNCKHLSEISTHVHLPVLLPQRLKPTHEAASFKSSGKEAKASPVRVIKLYTIPKMAD